MKKVFLTGFIGKNSSFDVYTENLKKNILQRKNNFELYDFTRKGTDFSWKGQIKGYLGYLKKLYKSVNNHEDNVIIDMHSTGAIPPLLLGRSETKHIIIVHDSFQYDKDFFQARKGIYKYFLYVYMQLHKLCYKIIFNKRNTYIVAISSASKKDLIRKFGNRIANKIHIIHNGMDLSSFVPGNNKEEYLLYVGSEIERKNLKNTIYAFSIVKKRFPNLVLKKAPLEKDKQNREKTLSYIKNCGLTVGKDVEFIDKYLELNDLVKLYQGAKIFVFPTLKEGFGFPIIEAEACGTPVITTNYEPMIELVPYKDMTVNPQEPKDIASKIEMMLDDEKLWKDMINGGLTNAKNYSWSNTAKKFIDLINQL